MEGLNETERLNKILEENNEKRIVVVGTTCTGKSTFVKNIKSAKDMDDLVFPLLTKKESDYVCKTPWTPEIGETMTKLTKERVIVEKGKPVFGTVLLDSDLVIYLKISDKLLEQRAKNRGSNFENAKNMQIQIEKDIKKLKIPVVEFEIK